MFTRRLLLGLGLAGLVNALALMFTGRARRHHRAAAQAAAKARELRRQAAATRQIRPLDRAIRKRHLSGELNRRVLGLYNSLDGDLEDGLRHAEDNNVHLRAELVLNHLGLTVDLRDVNAPLPSARQMARYRGVLVWFRGKRVKRPARYLAWLARQAEAGRKVVAIEGLGAEQDPRGAPTSLEAIKKTFAALGLEYHGKPTDDPEKIRVVSKDSGMVEFERKLPPLLSSFEQQALTDPAGQSFLKLTRTDIAERTSDMVAVTSRGGYVARGYAINEDQFGKNYVLQWRINPFAFFAKAFDVEQTPRPDFTTINGSRIYYSHIDGDGLPSISEIDRKSMCADLARREILERYDLPVTVSFVVAGIEPPPRGLGGRQRIEVARRIARLPNIEVACHGFAHPMNWRARGKARNSYRVPGYKMTAEKEIAYATRYINQAINPPGKAVRAMLWTGWCNPDADQLAIPYRIGIYNLNGGDPIMDGQFPSYLHLVPPMHRVGRHVQYFTSGPNDYILTEEWHPPYHRWANLIDTMRRSGYPRRVYPMNVYYHFYVAEKEAAMRATSEIMTYAMGEEPAPLWVSEYIDVVRDFATMRLARIAPPAGLEDPGQEPQPQAAEAWRVLNSGYARTLRFDRFDRHVDLARSRGVLGYYRDPRLKVLYVHLDETHDHTIVLSKTPAREPRLERASAYVWKARVARQRATMLIRGYGRKHLVLGGMTPDGRYRLVARGRSQRDEPRTLREQLRADSNGRLRWSGDINGPAITVEIERVAA